MKVFTASLNTKFHTIVRYKMSEDAVVDWESTIHKNVRSKDGQDAGNVDAIEGDTNLTYRRILLTSIYAPLLICHLKSKIFSL
jgi:hypothetical protein